MFLTHPGQEMLMKCFSKLKDDFTVLRHDLRTEGPAILCVFAAVGFPSLGRLASLQRSCGARYLSHYVSFIPTWEQR